MAESFLPPDVSPLAKLVICVRDIVAVASSFFDKHRLQNNLDHFSGDWATAYCIRESAELVRLRWEAERRRLPCHVVRYEDFTGSDETRRDLERFTDGRAVGTLQPAFATMGDYSRCNAMALPFRREFRAEIKEFSTMTRGILPKSSTASVENIRICSVTVRS